MSLVKSKFAVNTLIYLVGGSLNKATPFILLPVFTYYLEPKEFGKLSIYLVFVSVCLALIGMNMNVNISKNFHRVSKEELSKIIASILLIAFVLFLSIFIISTFVYLLSVEYFSVYSIFFVLIPVIAFLKFVVSVNTTIFRNEQKALRFAFYEIGMTSIVMLTTVVLLVYYGLGWFSQVIGLVVGGVIMTCLGINYLSRQNYLTFHFDSTIIKKILAISVPLVPHALGLVVINISDRLIIEQMLGLEEVGVYTVGYTFGMVVMLFTDSFMRAWSPWFYKKLSNPVIRNKKQIVKYTYYYLVGIFVLSLVLAVLSGFVLEYFIDQRYNSAKDLIVWVSLSYAVRGIYQIFFPYLVHLDRTNFLALSTLIAASTNIFLNYYFISIFGVIGAVFATMTAFTVSALLVFLYQFKHMSMPWNLRSS